MLTYTTITGDVLNLSDLREDERAHFDRCYAAYRDGVPFVVFQDLVTGPDNPLIRASHGRVTNVVWGHPLFQAIRDLEDRIGIHQGEMAAEPGIDISQDPLADSWVPSTEAARLKGVTVPGVHHAIKRGALIAGPSEQRGDRVLVSANSLARWTPSRVRQAAGRTGGKRS